MRETLGSRLGFLMLAAGSAVGLGNVWRFPFIVGKNGGAAFVIVYLLFLLILGFPLLAVELGIGRGAKRSFAAALETLAPAPYKKFWARLGAVLASGCFILMIYYTDVTGWLLKYSVDYGISGAPLGRTFTSDLTYMLVVVAVAAVVCLLGVVKGVERATKGMMLSLLVLLSLLVVKALTLPGAVEGLAFYLKPDWAKFLEHPWQATLDAMGQAFFTLSLGIGSMTICGSYVDERHSLVKETVIIISIDTFVALLSGLIIFPACATYQIAYTEGPALIFKALPQVFAQMAGGAFWGFLFFLFLAFAALTTVIAVFECLIAGLMDSLGLKRLPATLLVGVGVALFSLPCVFWDTALVWEDFAVSKLWLPLGALAQALFVVNGTYGWGWQNFQHAVSVGAGWNMPHGMRFHLMIMVPILIGIVLITGLVS